MKIFEVNTNDLTHGFANNIIRNNYIEMTINNEIDCNIDNINDTILLDQQEAALLAHKLISISCCIDHFVEYIENNVELNLEASRIVKETGKGVCLNCTMNVIHSFINVLLYNISCTVITNDTSVINIVLNEYVPEENEDDMREDCNCNDDHECD